MSTGNSEGMTGKSGVATLVGFAVGVIASLGTGTAGLVVGYFSVVRGNTASGGYPFSSE